MRAALVFLNLAAALAAPPAELPRVHLLGTGGTIAGSRQGLVGAEAVAGLAAGSGLDARITAEDFVRLPSSRMTPEVQLRLARRVKQLFAGDPGLAGIVVTHGTDSLEETAFLLDLVAGGERPVVVVGAMRSPTEPDSDGPRNLADAIRVAASPAARGLGVLVVLNGEVHAARDVRKTHATALDAFRSPALGPLGHVDGRGVRMLRRPATRLLLPAETVEPRVELITLVAGGDGGLLRAAAASGARGLVVEVFGNGNVPPAVVGAIREAREKGVAVVLSSRTRGGRIELRDELRQAGVVSAHALDGIKARTLLVVALPLGNEPAALQRYFDRLAGEGGGS